MCIYPTYQRYIKDIYTLLICVCKNLRRLNKQAKRVFNVPNLSIL